jgi:glycosyltransferase involved in cell wall biosynthesis
MRITIIIGPFYPIPPVLGGAVEKVHLLLAGAYRDAGHQVTIVSRRYAGFADDEIVDGIRHLRIASSDRSSGLFANLVLDLRYSLRVAIALPPADITITNGFFLPLVLPHARAGKIYVQIGRYPKGQMALYSRADRLQAVSKAVGRAVARQAPWLARRIRVIGYAVPDAFFAVDADVPRERAVLYVGRIAREKGIELLLSAFAALSQHLPAEIFAGWTLRIVGPHRIEQGGDGDEYLAELRTLAAQRAVPCQFTGPIFDQQALAAAYRRAAIFVYPSLAETGEALGLAPLEAMAAGCAVVVSGLQCFDDYVEDGVTGLQFDHRGADPAAHLAAALALLISEPERLQKIADAGRCAAANFRVAAIAGRMLDDFRSVLGDERRVFTGGGD